MSGAQFYCRSVNGGDYRADSRDHAAAMAQVYAPAVVVVECEGCGDRSEPELGGCGCGIGETYYESAIGVEISRARALAELADHGASVEEFDEEVGDFDSYLATTVLDWLGY